MFLSAAQMAKKYGLGREFVLQCVRSDIGPRFAHPSKVNEKGRCTGKWLIDEEKFMEAMSDGSLVLESC